jgi:succinoglycan biosynthesis protein ExoM
MTVIDICICTFRRPSLGRGHRLGPAAGGARRGSRIRIIVIDNDTRPTARDRAGAGRQGRGARSTISTRRAGTSRSRATRRSRRRRRATWRFSTMTKWPSPVGFRRSGRATSRAARRSCSAPSIRSIPRTRPDWMRADLGPCHAARLRPGRDPHRLYLQRADRPARPEIRALRFDPGLGRSGGEDSDYFARMVLMGGRIDYAPDARVTEPVAPDRLSFGWLARAALPDGPDPCGRPDAPSWACRPGARFRWRWREASGLRLHGADLRRRSRMAGGGGAARGAACRCRGGPRRYADAPVIYGGPA